MQFALPKRALHSQRFGAPAAVADQGAWQRGLQRQFRFVGRFPGAAELGEGLPRADGITAHHGHSGVAVTRWPLA